jgi:hypothetical protein
MTPRPTAETTVSAPVEAKAPLTSAGLVMSPSMTDRPEDFHLESRSALVDAEFGDVKRKTCLNGG